MPAAASHWPASKIQPGIGPLVFQHDQGLSDGDAIVVVNPDFLDDAAFQCTLLWLSATFTMPEATTALASGARPSKRPPPPKATTTTSKPMRMACRPSSSTTGVGETGLGAGGTVFWTRWFDSRAGAPSTDLYDGLIVGHGGSPVVDHLIRDSRQIGQRLSPFAATLSHMPAFSSRKSIRE